MITSQNKDRHTECRIALGDSLASNTNEVSSLMDSSLVNVAVRSLTDGYDVQNDDVGMSNYTTISQNNDCHTECRIALSGSLASSTNKVSTLMDFSRMMK